VDSGERGAPPVQLWELTWEKRDDSRLKATEKKTFLGHEAGAVYSVAFSRDGRYLLSAGQDHTVRVWDLAAKRKPMVLIPHSDFVYCVAVSPDGRLLASLGRDSIKMWSLADLLK
jgi:WD40 repeat protein